MKAQSGPDASTKWHKNKHFKWQFIKKKKSIQIEQPRVWHRNVYKLKSNKYKLTLAEGLMRLYKHGQGYKFPTYH